MSFSGERAKGSYPLAVIRWPSTRFNGTIVYFSPHEPEAKEGKEGKEERKIANMDPVTGEARSAMSVVGRDFFRLGRECHKIKGADMEGIEQILEDGGEGDEEQADWSQFEDRADLIKKKIAQAKKEIASRRRDFDLEKDGWIDPLTNDSSPEAVFITGPRGAGKSVYASKKMKHYAHLFPHNPILIVSTVQKDKAFLGIPNVQEVDLGKEFVKTVNAGLKLSDCMILFDDVDTIADKEVKKAVYALRGDCLETGRHRNVYVLNTSHVYFGGEKTLTALRESSEIVVYPKYGEKHYLPDFLKKIGGLDKAQIDRALSLPSRWVSIHRTAPRFLLHEHGGYSQLGPDPERDLGT